MQVAELSGSEIETVLSRLAGSHVTAVERVGGGRNSRVYRVVCEASGPYVAKFYPSTKADHRDRLNAEFTGLQFLWNNGVRCVPQPIAADKGHGCALYEYINGNKIASEEVTDGDIDHAVDFLATLKELSHCVGSRDLSAASEASFSARGVVGDIQRRLDRLTSTCTNEPKYGQLQTFLRDDFAPSFSELTGWCKSTLAESEMSFDEDLSDEDRTLSPSDFGFHNALRREDGQIAFLDFEYFGWDDPAKMICDFLLHPAMNIGISLKRRFLAGTLSRFGEYGHLPKRVEALGPLFGLKWCLILLNEFVPEDFVRREFASEPEIDRHGLQSQQLAKSRLMLQCVTTNYRTFPYAS